MCVGHNYIGTEHILLGLLREGEGVAARVMETLGADPSKIRTAVSSVYSTALFGSQPTGVSCCSAELTPYVLLQVIRMVGESQEQLVGAGAGGGSGSNKTPTLEEYGTNLTTQANEVNTVPNLASVPVML